MDELVKIWEKPWEDQIYMIAGWQQWADAGSISSGLPEYLINLTGAKKIGEIDPDGFYLFQIPGTHHLLRPIIELEEGYRRDLSKRENAFYYAELDGKGLVIFLGEEPHLAADRYAEAFFDAVDQLGIQRIAAVGGVYGAMPYDKDRDISCVYSLRHMKGELEKYAVRFSNYEGGTTIGTYLVDRAEHKGIEFVVFYALVPSYDFSQPSILAQGMRIETDFKAWHDLLRRINYMFGIRIDVSELEEQSEELMRSMEEKIDALRHKMPQLKIDEYLEKLGEGFTERTFEPLSDVWERGLRDLLDDLED